MKTFFKVIPKIITVLQILAIISIIAGPFIGYFIVGNSLCAVLCNLILSIPIGIALLIIAECVKSIAYSELKNIENI